MESVLVNAVGIFLIGVIIWWFLIAKPKVKINSADILKIVVQNGIYSPSIIKTKVNQPIKLGFLRKDDTPCSEYVIFGKFDISAKLPHNKMYVITIVPKEPGEFNFTCQMGMYRGTLIVENQHIA